MANQFQLNHNLFEAAMYDDLAKIKLILTSTESEIKPDIHFYNDGALTLACSNGNLEMVKYLLSSPELTEHACLNADYYQPFKAACIEEHFHILEYLIFEYNMKMDDTIENYLDKSTLNVGMTVKSMFKKRDAAKRLNDELSSELITIENNKKSLKI